MPNNMEEIKDKAWIEWQKNQNYGFFDRDAFMDTFDAGWEAGQKVFREAIERCTYQDVDRKTHRYGRLLVDEDTGKVEYTPYEPMTEEEHRACMESK